MNGADMVFLIVAIMLVSTVGIAILKKNIFTQMYTALMEKDYEEFFKRVDTNGAKALIPMYTREYLRLSAYMAQLQEQKVREQFNELMKMKLNPSQLCQLLCKGFQFYMGVHDQKRCKKIVEKMKDVVPEEQRMRYVRHYEIVFEHSVTYIPELEERIEKHRGKARGYLEYLLAKSYEAKKEKQKAEHYYRKAANDYKVGVGMLEQQIQL
ncbi:MAG: hypothetical protein Q4F05_08225 [bacterium]|nr:hypothetical protein [bacterium]